MATTTTTTTPTTVSTTTSWLKQHETMVIVFLVLLFGGYMFSKYADMNSAKKDAQNVAAQQAAVEAKANTAAALLQASQTAAQYQAMVTALTQQNAALAQAVAQRNTVLATNTTKDAVAPLPDLLVRWNMLAGTNVQVSGSNASVSDTDSRKTVTLLEQVPVLQANLNDETTVNGNLQKTIAEADVRFGADQNAIAKLNTQITVDANACNTAIGQVKADAKKSKWHFFKLGFITGFLSGAYIGHAL